MKTYVVTDGLTLSKNKDAIFSLLKGKEGMLYVNGCSFCTENAEHICQCIKEEREASLFEIGYAIGEINSLAEQDRKNSTFSYSCDKDMVYVSVLKETEDLVKPFTSNVFSQLNLLFENSYNPSNVNKRQKLKTKPDKVENLNKDDLNKDGGTGKESQTEKDSDLSSGILDNDSDKAFEKPYLRNFDTHIKKKGRKSKQDALPTLSDNEDGRNLKNSVKDNKIETNAMLLYPETLDDLTRFPIKNEKGTRITPDGRIAILHLRDFGSSKIAEVTGIPQTTISALYSNLKAGRLNITAEQVEAAVEDRKKMVLKMDDSSNAFNDDANNAETAANNVEKEEKIEEDNFQQVSDTTVPMLAVPALMEKQMKYDKNMPGLENISIAGYPLSGNIITDSENVLGYRLSKQDKDALINAFFSLRAYEETFITDLQFGNFSHMEDVPKLKEVCTIFEKIRKIKVLGRKKK